MMKKKSILRRCAVLLLAISCVLSSAMLPVFADAQGEAGTAENPYLIESADALLQLAAAINDGNNADICVRLADDIVIDGSWTPFGKNAVFPFRGTFDGDGHTVTVTVDDPDLSYFGFFGCLEDATVKNLTVCGEVYCSEPYAYVGGIAGRARGNVTLEQCVSRVNVSALARGSAGVGGLIGGYDANMDYAWKDICLRLNDCTGDGLIMVTGTDANAYVGGMVGSNKNCTQLTGCASLGTVYAPGAYVGGLLGQAGYQAGECYPTITDCRVEAALCGADGKTGRLYGRGTIAAERVTGSGTNDAVLADMTDQLLLTESQKYAAVYAVSSKVSAGEAITPLKDGSIADETVAFSCSQGEKDMQHGYLICDAQGIRLAKKNETGSIVTETATLMWSDQSGNCLRKPITIHIYPGSEDASRKLMDSIAKTYANRSGEWVVFDMAVYEKLGFGENTTDKDNYRNLTVNALASDSALVTDRAKGEIILSALDTDTTKLTPYDSQVSYSNAEKMQNMRYGESQYIAPWVLLAEEAGQLVLTDAQRSAMVQTLTSAQGENGLFYSIWGTEKYDDVDTTGTALAALARLYDTDPAAKELADRAIEGLSRAQSENGSFGNINSDAMVICGLAAMGISPSDDSRFVKVGGSLADAVLLYQNDNGDGFTAGYVSGTQGEKAKALATEQGFRALVVLEQMKKSDAFNVYSQKIQGETLVKTERKQYTASAAGKAEEEPAESGDASQGSVESDTVTVSLKVLAENNTAWLSANVTAKKGDSAADVIRKGLGSANMSAVGVEDGYIQSVTWQGQTLSQFDRGANSGWLYQVNGKSPAVGILDYKVQNGDAITLYYTADYTKEEDAKIWSGSGSNRGNAVKYSGQTAASDAEKETEQENIPAFLDVDANMWYFNMVQYVCRAKLMQGISADRFAPEDAMTRAMFVTVLYRMDGAAKTDAAAAFADVAADTWYAPAVAWAKENGIVNGVTDTLFAPEENVTREQMAMILMRYVGEKGFDTGAVKETDAVSYQDSAEIAEDAKEAVSSAAKYGLMSGNPDGTFSPKAMATRAEAAAILMRVHQNWIAK